MIFTMTSPAIVIQTFILLFREEINLFVRLSVNFMLKPHIVLLKTRTITV